MSAPLQLLVEAIPPLLVSNWSISSPTRALSTCRLLDSTDATYGTVGWLPPTDGSPFAILGVRNGTASYPEAGRTWVTAHPTIFLGLAHSDTPGANFNYADQALQWADALVALVATNSRLAPTSTNVSPIVGDVRWTLTSFAFMSRQPVFGDPYDGVEFATSLRIAYSTPFQS